MSFSQIFGFCLLFLLACIHLNESVTQLMNICSSLQSTGCILSVATVGTFLSSSLIFKNGCHITSLKVCERGGGHYKVDFI